MEGSLWWVGPYLTLELDLVQMNIDSAGSPITLFMYISSYFNGTLILAIYLHTISWE